MNKDEAIAQIRLNIEELQGELNWVREAINEAIDRADSIQGRLEDFIVQLDELESEEE